MDLNPIDIKETPEKGVKGEAEPAWEEVDEAHALAVARTRDDVLPWRARLQLLHWWEKAPLPQILRVLRTARGLGPVTVNLFQARLLIRRLLLATRTLGLHTGLLLAHGGGGAKF